MIEGKIAIYLGFANDYSDESKILETLEEEVLDIDDALSELRNSGKCHMIRRRCLTLKTLYEDLQKHRGKIDIFHFSGHADENILLLENNENDTPNELSLQGYIDLIKNQAGGIRLLFLNGCKTIQQAQELIQTGVKAVIATVDEIDEQDGLVFSKSFYKALSLGSSIEEAFVEAKAYLNEMSDSIGSTGNLWKLVSLDDLHKKWKPFPNGKKEKKLNLLQLSDVNNIDFDFSSLKKFLISKGKEIDVILCTGNITSSAGNLSVFKQDYENIIKNLVDATNVSADNIFFCPGLSDLDQTKVIDAVHDRINEGKTNQEILDFVSVPEQFTQSCNISKHYRQITELQIIDPEENTFRQLYSIHLRNIAGKKIGIVCINSFWSYYNKVEQLVFPTEHLEDAYELIKTSNYKILISNHDLSNLKPFNRKEIENLVYSKFDFLMLGAFNNPNPNEKPVLISNEGIYKSFSGMNQSKGIDYIFHEFDFEKNQIESHITFYTDGDGCLVEENDTQIHSFPQGIEKRKQVKLIQVLHKRLDAYYDIGDNLFIDYKKEGKRFLDLFTQPVVREKPAKEIEVLSNNSHYSLNKFRYLFKPDQSFMLIGRDKSGKSSLLIFLAIKILESFNKEKMIPIYIDLKNFKNKVDALNFSNHISSFLERNQRDTIDILSKYKFKLLLDNFDPNNSELTRKIKEFLNSNPNFTYVFSTDQTTVRSYEDFDFGFNHYKKLYIHEISRPEIRSLAKKSIEGTEKYIDQVVQRLVTLFKQYRMPFNYWTVSIFLWILSKRKLEEFEVQNNSELIELYIQELLGQKELAYDTTNRFSFSKYKQFLSFLAWKLYKKHSNERYSTEYESLFNYTKEFIAKSKRHVANPEKIIEYVLNKGILKQVSSTHYSFRLNGTFEYFLAKEMLENEEFLNEVLENDNIYKSFKNELDLYSAFEKSDRKKDSKLLKTVYKKTIAKFKDHNNRFLNEGTTDQNLVNKAGSKSILEIVKEVNVEDMNPLSYEDKDSIESSMVDNEESFLPFGEFNSEVIVKKQYDKSSNQLEVLEDYLFIISRVFRNVDVEDEGELLDDEIFSFILDSTCNLGFLLLEEVTESLKETYKENSNYDSKFGMPTVLLKIMGNVLPIIVQDLFHQSVGHVTLENVIKSKISELEKDIENNQLKLFILYFTLMDLDLKNVKSYLSKIIKVAKIGIIKSCVLTKILYYLIFKAYNNPNLVRFLKSEFRSYQIKLNPKVDTSKLDKHISEIDQTILIKKSSEKSLKNK